MTRARWKMLFAGAAVLAALLAAAVLPVRGPVISLVQWTGSLGWWAPLIVVAGYIVTALAFVPGLLLSIGAGFLFSLPVGLATASIGTTLGATAAFLTGRRLLRSSLEPYLTSRPRFAMLQQAVARDGFKIVLLARLSPVLPYNLLNYALGLTTVRLRDFVLASWLGMFPITLVYVYFGSTLAGLAEADTTDRLRGGWPQAVSASGLLATVVLLVWLTRMARQAFRAEVATIPVESAGG